MFVIIISASDALLHPLFEQERKRPIYRNLQGIPEFIFDTPTLSPSPIPRRMIDWNHQPKPNIIPPPLPRIGKNSNEFQFPLEPPYPIQKEPPSSSSFSPYNSQDILKYNSLTRSSQFLVSLNDETLDINWKKPSPFIILKSLYSLLTFCARSGLIGLCNLNENKNLLILIILYIYINDR
jgi:hypothetical protein